MAENNTDINNQHYSQEIKNTIFEGPNYLPEPAELFPIAKKNKKNKDKQDPW